MDKKLFIRTPALVEGKYKEFESSKPFTDISFKIKVVRPISAFFSNVQEAVILLLVLTKPINSKGPPGKRQIDFNPDGFRIKSGMTE